MSERAGSRRVERFTAHPRRALWTLSLPIMFGMAVQTLYMVVDLLFVGRVSGSALIALSFNMPLLFLVMGVVFGLGSGVTALIARAIGAGDDRRADSVAEHSLGLGLALAAVFTSSGLLFGPTLLRGLGVPPAMMSEAWGYFRIVSAGFPFMVSSVFFRSILSGEGNVKTPMMVLAGGTFLNIALDPLFIFTLGMGVSGAALATLVSQAAVTTVYVYLLFFKTHAHVRFDLGNFRWDASILARIFGIGAPASVSFLVMALSGAIFNRMLVALSPDAVAGFQIGTRIDHVVILPIVSVSTGLVTLVGMFHGAGRRDLLRSIVGYAMRQAVVIGVTIGALFFFFAPWLVGLFSQEPTIRDHGTSYLRTIVWSYPLIGFSILAGRAFQGLGRGVPELALTALRLLISAPLAYLSVFVFGQPIGWIWLAPVVAAWVSGAVALGWLHGGLRRVTAKESAPTSVERC